MSSSRAPGPRVPTREEIIELVEDARRRGVRPVLPKGLQGADLNELNLAGVDLRGAILGGADLTDADLTGAVLTGASLDAADLTGAVLTGASLDFADLTGALLTGALLTGARVQHASFSYTVIVSASLAGVLGLSDARHRGPSSIGADTFELTAAGLTSQPETQRHEVFTFLRKAGVAEPYIEAMRLSIAKPIEFYSCFISYSHADKEFARLLYDRLQGLGIRCWLDEHELLAGDNIYDAVDRGIRLWDKVLLCCSETALTSWWVDQEIDSAFEKERRLQKERGKKVTLVIPLDLDGYLFKWQDGKGSKLRERYALGFAGWDKDAQLFGERVDLVIKALRSDAGAREEPPAPKV